MHQRVDAIFWRNARPPAAKVREPVKPAAPSRTIVSVVIEIVSTPAEMSFLMLIQVPTGYTTDAFAGIVQIRTVVSALG